MQRRELGRDGPTVSVIGLGAWPIGGGMGQLDEDQAVATIRTALDHGINLIDTAQAYRASEAFLGKALTDGYRDKAFVATKVSGTYTQAAIRAAVDNSLRQIGVEAIDLYQVHAFTDEVPQEEVMGTMLALKHAGKVKEIGVSNYDHRQMDLAWSVTPFRSNQVCYNMLQRQVEPDDFPYCESHGIGVLAHSPLAKGLLSGKYTPRHGFTNDDERSTFRHFQGGEFAKWLAIADRLKPIAADLGLTLLQLAIAWLLRRPVVGSVLVGAKTPEQVLDYLPAAETTLSEEALTGIDTILADEPQLPNRQRKAD